MTERIRHLEEHIPRLGDGRGDHYSGGGSGTGDGSGFGYSNTPYGYGGGIGGGSDFNKNLSFGPGEGSGDTPCIGFGGGTAFELPGAQDYD